ACDILMPAALESVLRNDNAAPVQSRIVGVDDLGSITSRDVHILYIKTILIVRNIYLIICCDSLYYVQWLKNLSHVRYGRLEKRFEENMYNDLIDIIESTTGKRVSDLERKTILRGPDEIDLVHSGLEDTMIGSYREIRDIYKNREGVEDLR